MAAVFLWSVGVKMEVSVMSRIECWRVIYEGEVGDEFGGCWLEW